MHNSLVMGHNAGSHGDDKQHTYITLYVSVILTLTELYVCTT